MFGSGCRSEPFAGILCRSCKAVVTPRPGAEGRAMRLAVRVKQAALFALATAVLATVVLRAVAPDLPPPAPPAPEPVASSSSDPGPARCDAPADRRLTM